MRLFHGVANITDIKFGKTGIEIKGISTTNLRGKKVELPEEYVNLLKCKMNKFVNDWLYSQGRWYMPGEAIEKYTSTMYTVAMNDDYMTIAIQHPSDVPTKKKGYKIAKGRLDKIIAQGHQVYEDDYGFYPNWLYIKYEFI